MSEADGRDLAPSRGLAWDDTRVHLWGQIRAFNPDLAGLYETIVDLLGQPLTRTRMTLIGYSVRELINRGADVLLNDGEPPLATRVDRDHACRALAEAWAADGNELPALQAAADVDPPLEDAPPLRSVSSAVWTAAGQVVAGEQRISANANQRYAAFAVGAPTEVAHSATLLARGIFQFFRPWTHFNWTSTLPEMERVAEHIGKLEAVLRSRMGRYTESIEAVEEILTQANRVEEAGEGRRQ